jgi:hypothetical protein
MPAEVNVNVKARRPWLRSRLWPVVAFCLTHLCALNWLSEKRTMELGKRYLAWGLKIRVGNGPWESVTANQLGLRGLT